MLVDRPLVMVRGREAALLAWALGDLLERGYFDGLTDEDRARVEVLAVELADCVANRGQVPNGVRNLGDDRLVSYGCAAVRLDVSERTVRRLVASGRLPVVAVGGSRRIRVADLEVFIENREAS